ncbi:MAG: tRNA lysidine(34) synthetase TilS [Chlamydiales bacterium]|nr:tRNA lysidine(34) synthetase TilS [Chlamydiales bacterium]
MSLFHRVQKFLEKSWDQKSPLLLGYSGGPDSKALLYLLLKTKVPLHLAHVDHGWREESALQAAELERESRSLGLPFHTIRLEPDRRESVAREKRLSFFSSLFEKIPFQALLLAHQADDLAETALKRVFEGAHLVYLSGLKESGVLREMTIWRPLLSSTRTEILGFIENQGLVAIEDPTNLYPHYLRARMRTELFPFLSRSFGKEVSKNLTILAKRSCELKEYLDRKTDFALRQLRKGPWGWMLPPVLTEAIEVSHVLQRLKIPLTRQILEELVQALIEKRANYKAGPRLLADRGYFFYLKETFPLPIEPMIFREGVFACGNWCLKISRTPLGPLSSEWGDLFCGKASFAVPQGDGQLYMSHRCLSKLRKQFNQQKIPAFLRSYIPCLEQKEKPVVDLFSYRNQSDYYIQFVYNEKF